MFEAGFTYIFSKSLMNTRTKKDIQSDVFFLLCSKKHNFIFLFLFRFWINKILNVIYEKRQQISFFSFFQT